MSLLEHYRLLYEHEKDGNNKMLTMLESVPEASRADSRFQQAVTLAGHLTACRANWLERMAPKDRAPVAWWDEQCDLAALRPRFAAIESQWTDYLASLGADQLAEEFEFAEGGEERFRLPVEAQIIQLIGHAFYHRGQVALLVDQLGGETVDTDYADWWWETMSRAI